MTQLRKMMLEEIERRNFSQNTTECHIRAVEEFAQYFNRPPDQLGPEHIRAPGGTRSSEGYRH
jgi:integrase/recombinase XerD